MTISITAKRMVVNGSGSAGPFAIADGADGIYFTSSSELVFTKTDTAGTTTVLTDGVDYTVTGSNTDAGTFTLTSALASGETLVVERVTPRTQTTTFNNGLDFSPASVMAALDKLTRITQEIDDYSFVNNWLGAWATATAYEAGNLVSNDGSAYFCVAAHTSSASDEPGTGGSWGDYWDVFSSAGADGTDGASLDWEGSWQTATPYVINDAVFNDGSSYVCTAAHTSSAGDEPGTGASWTDYWDLMAQQGASGAGTGDMLAATYDPANISQQVVGTTATQTLTNKTLTTPTLVLQDANGSAPTTDGQIKFDRTGENLEVGDGTGTVLFLSEAHYASTDNGKGASKIGLEDAGGFYTSDNVEDAFTEVVAQGKHTVWLPAGAFTPRATNGPAGGSTELATNDIMLSTLDFDQSTEEGAGCMILMPKSWNEGTVTFKPTWTAASGTGGVVWELSGVAFSDNDALDAAPGTGQTSTDTFIAANDCHIGPESSAITIGGTPAEGDLVYFQIKRLPGNGSDTLNADAKLIGIHLYLTIDAPTDA